MVRLFILISLFNYVFGQQLPNGNCVESTLIPDTYFYPNTTTTFSNSNIIQECLYLCGPNTVVYDTLIPSGKCRTVFVNSGCIYYTKNGGCSYLNGILAKNNSTIVVMPNANCSSFRIWYEPNATIIIQCTPLGGLQTYSCSSITFPSVNCTTNILENSFINQSLKIWPNPASSNINIELRDIDNRITEIKIVNQLGQVIFECKNNLSSNEQIPIDKFLSGLYFIYVNTKNGPQKEKFIFYK